MLKRTTALSIVGLAVMVVSACTGAEIKRGIEQVRGELGNGTALGAEEIAAG